MEGRDEEEGGEGDIMSPTDDARDTNNGAKIESQSGKGKCKR